MIGRTQNQNQLSKSILCAAVAASVIGLTAGGAGAADVVRSGAGGTLNLTTAWDGGTPPTANDVAVWDTTSSLTGQIGADASWAGIRIASPTGNVSINGANVLTLGASGIDMSAATGNLTLQTGATTTPATGITLGATQTWNVGAGRTLTAGSGASGITGAADVKLIKSGAGTLALTTSGSNLNTFAGGLTINAGTVLYNANTVTSGGVITSGAFGTGTLTINGGTISASSSSGRDFANDVVVGGDFTIGNTGAGRFRAAGTWDLGGVTRNVTLTNSATGINNSSEQFGFLAQGGKTFTLSNGNLRFVAGANATAAAPAGVNFAQGSGGVNFANNSTVTLGANVIAWEGSTQSMGGTNAPKMNLEAGSVLYMASNTAPKNFTANSLTGGGLVASGVQDLASATPVLASNLTIDGATGSANFSGTIQDNYTIFGLVGTAKVNVLKTGGNTQTFSGTNTYTGTTTVSGGTLVLGSAQALPQASATTVGGASGAILKLGTTGQATIDSLTLVAGGKVDLGKGQLLLNNGGGASALAAVAAQVASGRAGGDGFFSSNAVAGTSDIGFKDTGSGIYLRYTYGGDADLNGTVDFNDFLVLQNNFNQPGTFSTGDFNYSGDVDFNDFLILQNNFNNSLSGAPAAAVTAAQVAAMQSFAATVPEPTALAVVGLGAMAMLRRRRA